MDNKSGEHSRLVVPAVFYASGDVSDNNQVFTVDNEPKDMEILPNNTEKSNANSTEQTVIKTDPLNESNSLESSESLPMPSNVSPIKNKKHHHHLTNEMETMMHLLKGNIGPGMLAMPEAIMNAGLLLGTLGIPAIGFVIVHCMHMLVECQGKLCDRFSLNRDLDYEHVAEKAVTVGPIPLRRFSNWAHRVVTLFLLITQLGFCCIYSIFVATNIREVGLAMFAHEEKADDLNHHPSFLRYIMLVELPLMILINCIQSLKKLSHISAIANVLQVVGIFIIFYAIFQPPYYSTRPFSRFLFGDYRQLPLYFGSVVYTFESIGLIIPIRNKMAKPDRFLETSGVLNTMMALVMIMYLTMGFYGYLKFGDAVCGSVTLNLPKQSIYQLCQFMFAVAVFLSYALQFYVPFHIFWSKIKIWFNLVEGERRTTIFDYSLRTFMVTATFVLAALIPKLGLFISLVGAMSSSSLALIFPPLIDIFTHWEDKEDGKKWWRRVIKDLAIALFGLLGFATGTYVSLQKLIDSFRSKHHLKC